MRLACGKVLWLHRDSRSQPEPGSCPEAVWQKRGQETLAAAAGAVGGPSRQTAGTFPGPLPPSASPQPPVKDSPFLPVLTPGDFFVAFRGVLAAASLLFGSPQMARGLGAARTGS